MKEKVLKEEYLAVVLLRLILFRVLSIILDVLRFFFRKISILVQAIFAFPAGYYSLYKEEEKVEKEVIYYDHYYGSRYTQKEWNYLYHRIPFWPRFFGRNVWIYTMIPPLVLAHYVYDLNWGWSIILGLASALAVPLLWGIVNSKS